MWNGRMICGHHGGHLNSRPPSRVQKSTASGKTVTATPRPALSPGANGRGAAGVANQLAVEGIVAQQILLEVVEWANQQRPLLGRVIRGEEGLASLIRDRVCGSRGRGSVGLPVAGQRSEERASGT